MTEAQKIVNAVYLAANEDEKKCLAPSIERIKEKENDIAFLVFLDMVILLALKCKAISTLKADITVLTREQRVTLVGDFCVSRRSIAHD